MRGFLASSWINVLGAVTGGLLLGFGIGRFAHTPSLVPAAMSVFGLILLWWSISDRRKARPGDPESEIHGDHTIE
jgi:hypothetical protein